MKHAATALWVVSVALSSAQAAETVVEIPVTRVVLFSSGVGYFQHDGEVDGDAVTKLMFRTGQINDVLKSMILQDEGEGKITCVNYASQDPVIRALKSFAIDVSEDPDLASLLTQVRGAEVVVMTPEKITGKIVGIETRQETVTIGGAHTIITKTVLNLLTPQGIKAIPMSTVTNITLTDEKLAGELNKALDLLITSHDTQRKPVEVQFTGKGKRKVHIGYIAETPIWKASYRLDLSGKKPLIQGWAIVENTGDVDWNKVGLSLVSGRPISFIQDLYTPLYMPRHVVQPELYASLRPQTYEEGAGEVGGGGLFAGGGTNTNQGIDQISERKTDERSARRARGGEATVGVNQGLGSAVDKELGYADRGATGGIADLTKGVQSVAAAGKVGELFNFAIKDPVSLPRRRSAMLPIVNADLAAEKVSIYNASVLPKNPLNGVWLKNTTGMKMIGGPVTVFDGGMYAGDARIDNLVPDDKRLLSYAVDLNVTVDPSVKSDSRVVSVKIVRGSLEVRNLHTFEQTYTIKNKAEDKRTLIVEHPFQAERKLIAPEKYEEKTPALYRFRVEVDKGAQKDFLVKEEQTVMQSVAIVDHTPEALLSYTKTGQVSKGVLDAIQKASELKSKAVQLETQMRDLTTQKQTLSATQDRLRKNIETVGKDSEPGKNFIAKLVDLEKQIDALDARIGDLQKAIDSARKELADYLKNLNVD
jgi:hypothetical protein